MKAFIKGWLVGVIAAVIALAIAAMIAASVAVVMASSDVSQEVEEVDHVVVTDEAFCAQLFQTDPVLVPESLFMGHEHYMEIFAERTEEDADHDH